MQGGELTQTNLKGMYQDEIIGGVEVEVAKGWAIGAKGIYRSLGRVVEDRCDLAVNPDIAQYFNPRAPRPARSSIPARGTRSERSRIRSTRPATRTANGRKRQSRGRGACDSTQPRRFFRGLEVTATHRFSNSFYLLASYLYSKLEGNYSGNLSQTREGGQADPNINADFDYPGLSRTRSAGCATTARTSSKSRATTRFPSAFGGRERLLQHGPPVLDPRLCVGCGRLQRGLQPGGLPRPAGLRGRSSRLLRGRSPPRIRLHFGSVSITPVVDVFNLLNRQGVLSREELFNNTGGTAGNDPRSGIGQPGCTAQNASLTNVACASNPTYGKDIGWQNPRVVRLGARVSF